MTVLLIAIFVLGYTAIALEHRIGLNKAGIALLTGILMWALLFLHSPMHADHLTHLVAETAQIIFFLMGAMAIVELIDLHEGFQVVTRLLSTTNPVVFLWLIVLITFVLSPVLDNLTTAIVMTSVTKKIVPEKKDLIVYASMIVIAANAGGAWSPIGDVTTTMLWIGGRITPLNVMSTLILPSILSLAVPVLVETYRMRTAAPIRAEPARSVDRSAYVALILGMLLLFSVPAIKTLTGLPPFMGVLLGLAIFWIYTEFTRRGRSADFHAHVTDALQRMDLAGLLFFVGILLAVGALGSAGLLKIGAAFLNEAIPDWRIVTGLIGILSAIVDNVPLVAASLNMYDLAAYPVDHGFWLALAYAAGTGGSLLIIGSAAGVVAMGIAGIDFVWYLRRVTLPTFGGYVLGLLFLYGTN